MEWILYALLGVVLFPVALYVALHVILYLGWVMLLATMWGLTLFELKDPGEEDE